MNDVMEQIIESLAFEIEAVPNENKGQMSTNVYNDPINVKIRIRNKDQNKILRQGVISIPNKDNPMYSNEKIQLSNSDQTIMSFNVLMEQDESTNKQRKNKRKFRFFKRGSCLGNQTEEDQFEFQRRCDMDNEQLVPIKSTSINDMNKRNFTLTKMYGNSDTRRMEKRTHKDILGECKPGGCLDPPYGEDKYSYVPKLIQMSKIDKNSIKRKSNEVAYKKPLNKNTNIKEKDEISYVSDKKDQLPISTNISLSNTKKSNSIITYPSISSSASLNMGNTQKIDQYNNNDSRLSHISRENVETYFISPKKIKINKFQERTNGTDFGIEKQSFVKPLSQDQDILKESKPEILKNYENTHPEGVVVDSKMTIQSNNQSFEKIKINSRTQISSLADLSSLLATKISLNLTKNDVITKSSLTSLNNTIVSERPDTAESSVKISLNSVTVSSASPKTIYKVESDTTILYTKNNVGQNKDPTKQKSSSKTFQQDQSFIPTKLDNGIEMSEDEKETKYKENGDELESEFPIEGEEVKLINEFSSIKSLDSNQSCSRQNENTKEITNPDLDVIIPNASIFLEKSSNNISIVDNHLAQNEDIKTLNQDLEIPLTYMNPILNSNFLNVDTIKSISLIDKDNEPYLEQKYDHMLINTKIDSNISSNDTKNIASFQQQIETKSASLTAINEKHNSILSNDVNGAPIDMVDDGHINLATLPGLKESNDQLIIGHDNDLQISVKSDTDNNLTHETNPEKTTIKSVKSDIENSELFIDSKYTELLRKIQSSPLATRSLTSMERDLNRYNTLKNYPVSDLDNRTTDLDLASALETGLSDFVNADVTANSKSNEPVEIFTAVNNDLEQDSFTEKSKSGTNISLSINEHVKTPPPVELQHVIDNSEIQAQLSINDQTKFLKNENIINLNEVLSTNEVNIQRSQETFVKLDKENESIPISNLDTSKDDQTIGFYETSTSLIDDETNKKENRDFMHSLSKDTNLKETIHLNMAFQSFYSEKDGNVIRTIDTTKNDVQRYENDNILKFMTLVKLGDISEISPISIPIDREKKLLLQITKAKEKEDENQEITKIESISPKQDPKHKLVVFDEDKDDTSANNDSDKKDIRGSIKKCITKNTKSDGNLQLTLDNMYNQKLLPLHNTIKHLKNDVDGLLKQQLLIKDELHNDKRIQLHKIPNNNKTCCCIEHLLLKH